jgi:hypothetical protein
MNWTEPKFPYRIKIYSIPAVIYSGDETETEYELSAGTEIEVLCEDLDTLRMCRIAERYFWLDIGEISYGN